MNTEVLITLLISISSLAFGVYSGSCAIKRDRRAEDRKDASEMAAVLVKLEDISTGIGEIKNDVSNVKGDIKELTERLIVAEQQIRQANIRIDQMNTGERK